MDVLVLLEARGGGEGLAAVGAGVGPRPHVLRADVPLEVAGVRKHLRGKNAFRMGGKSRRRRACVGKTDFVRFLSLLLTA